MLVAAVVAGLVLFRADGPRYDSLSDAVVAGDLDAAQIILDGGADPDSPRVHGFTPLQRAILRDDPAMIALLLESGANPEAVALEGLTAIHVAGEAGAAEALGLLVGAGADLDARSVNGMNAIDHAAAGGDPATIEVLVAAGADLDTQSGVVTQGHGYPIDTESTPLGIAARAGHTEAVVALLDLGAKVDAPSGAGHTPLLLAVFGGSPPELVQALLDAGADPTVRAVCVERCSTAGGDALHWARHLGRSDLVPLLEP